MEAFLAERKAQRYAALKQLTGLNAQVFHLTGQQLVPDFQLPSSIIARRVMKGEVRVLRKVRFSTLVQTDVHACECLNRISSDSF